MDIVKDADGPARRQGAEADLASAAARRTAFVPLLGLGVAFYALCLHVAEVDVLRLFEGLPRLAGWIARSWPPDLSEIDVLARRGLETVAMATVGVSFGAIIAAPLCLLAARNIGVTPLLALPARWLLNALRGIDSFVFALIFVAAVGLGPFAGVLGVALHTAGSIAKLWAETIETTEPGPVEAARMSGAGRLRVFLHAQLPDALPQLSSILLYMWEFNVRASTVLGVVGAGGIGQELKNSVDLLQFDRVLTILLVILAMVTAIDQLSAWLRRRLS
ncbi:MAG TPA: phosphonate ABC transporter, permease protein PhnE [Bosea sp. (in: a-proteobacteria)]|jgi:phosphonate transport system permease protein|uniref:phosphonate ABC transporter, permease protein PhnE n=1 Tax=Bosea sp. (in: a-proteobacteria) TaxID=1871050 RepID=UPI002DDDA436|nr:phosphonate ABC transporter, permease protein PhnE [Bosea sp. (in: a-proteobacteria)]HEV2553410.1 phosphonate ABC transporter, permease protein PhnE [Bosea sp. (in: a-proteobacteria)]